METLIASADDPSVDGPATAGYPLERLDIATRGHQILAARGIAAETATYDQLAAAYEQAERELASGTPNPRMTGREANHWALDEMATKILASLGKTVVPGMANTATQTEYIAAVQEAETKLGIEYR